MVANNCSDVCVPLDSCVPLTLTPDPDSMKYHVTVSFTVDEYAEVVKHLESHGYKAEDVANFTKLFLLRKSPVPKPKGDN
jgi:hypothetical protein